MEGIAKQLQSTRKVIGKILRKAGMGGNVVQKLTEHEAAEVIQKTGFVYVSGFIGAKKNVTVRCNKCGGTFERQFHIFSEKARETRNVCFCPLCTVEETKQRQQQRQQQRQEHAARINAERKAEAERVRRMREADLISRQLMERLAMHVCKNCGKEYCISVTGYNSTQYCSEKCGKRWAMRVKNDRRLRRIKNRIRDTDITLEKLFERDSGVCYLCGNICDWSDGYDQEGKFIAGDRYPSIDHVKPLSKGGTHTWDNVKLACRRCNLIKRDHFNPRSVPK